MSIGLKVGYGPQGFLTKEECKEILDRCIAQSSGGGDTRVTIQSVRTSGVEWARSRAHVARDVHDAEIHIMRTIRGASSVIRTTRLDDEGLREAIRFTERSLTYNVENFDTRPLKEPMAPISNPTLWSDATSRLDGEQRGEIVRRLLEPADAAGLLAAGELEVKAKCFATMTNTGIFRYFPMTRVSFSNTVRDAKGTGSGWAGMDNFDVERIDMPALAQRALDKCTRSMNPVAIEPGCYTAILEPQAVADLFGQLALWGLDRQTAEEPRGPFGRAPGMSKIGERVFSPRITWSADPMDADAGFLPFHPFSGAPFLPVTWVEQGVLRELAYNSRQYALGRLGRELALYNSNSWRLSGGTMSTEEMIATTKRGLLVTRLHGLAVSDFNSFTCTGYTRDGLWLIENGKITKPVKNFRFTESPMFIFNKIDQLGAPQRVLALDWGDWAWVAPPAKVHDFNFTQLADSI